LANHGVEIVWSNRELFDESYNLYQDREDKDWSLTDCASFVVMNERNITTAFTTDGHFAQAGFQKLLEG
jgi:predicted nucleic acid-binding protein